MRVREEAARGLRQHVKGKGEKRASDQPQRQPLALSSAGVPELPDHECRGPDFGERIQPETCECCRTRRCRSRAGDDRANDIPCQNQPLQPQTATEKHRGRFHGERVEVAALHRNRKREPVERHWTPPLLSST